MNRISIPAILLAGATIAGVLDILFAISFAAYRDITPVRLLQTVASGALGDSAFAGGKGTAMLGLGFHFALSYLWAALFAFAVWRFPALTCRPLISGVLFGVVVFLAMRLLVLPLSAYPYPVSFRPLATTLDLASHILLFGVPIAVATGKALARWPRDPSRHKPLRSSA